MVDITNDISKNQAIPHKGEIHQKYSMEFKKATIKYAQENSIHSAAKKFKVDRKRVCELVHVKLTDVELEEEVLSWIQQLHLNILRISRKLIMFKDKSICNEKCGDSEELKVGFVASNGWLTKFLKRTTFLCEDK